MTGVHRVVAVQPLDGYRIRVRFDDGAEGEVDLSDLAGKGVFAAWVDDGNFDRAFVDPESGTVAWPGGIDLCPVTLYNDVTRAAPHRP